MPKQPRSAVRIWQLRPWNTSPLMRASDRWEALVWILAVIAVLAAVPMAGAIGTASYTAAAARIDAENAAKVAVTATLTEEPQQVAAAMNRNTATLDIYTAPVRWTWQDRSGTATVNVPGGAAPGDQVRVWLGPDGNPAPGPLPSSAAATEGIGVALTVLSAIWGSALAGVCVTAWLLSTRRAAHWEREWLEIDHRIGGEDRR
ncbi:hypothetical protein [Nocardia sp. XZ_19_385]|uniref:Rv1733c family protein n=1 Tax=Nocardia sp. XZ_19_385 TaxID=2769488 RepID=UPI00188DCC8C|nr:hypothetical protein [Nocardia sp. XZ_19_385]